MVKQRQNNCQHRLTILAVGQSEEIERNQGACTRLCYGTSPGDALKKHRQGLKQPNTKPNKEWSTEIVHKAQQESVQAVLCRSHDQPGEDQLP